jgi:hypothetical protein
MSHLQVPAHRHLMAQPVHDSRHRQRRHLQPAASQHSGLGQSELRCHQHCL